MMLAGTEEVCTPTTSPGRFVAAAIWSRSRAEVLLASTGALLHRGVEPGEDLFLQVEVLVDRFDHDVRVGDRVRSPAPPQ